MFASTHLFSFNIINLKMIITVKTLDIFLIQETSKLQTMRMERYDILSFFPFIFFLSALLPPQHLLRATRTDRIPGKMKHCINLKLAFIFCVFMNLIFFS